MPNLLARPIRIVSIVVVLLSAVSHSRAEGSQALEALRESFQRPETIEFPEHAPYSPQIATLGKMLFFDPRLSGAQNMSCSSCHNPSFGWETPVDKAIGALNVALDRHAPTVLNLADASMFYWDGRANSLEEQAMGPITHPKEMAASFPELVKRLNQIEGYRHWFNELFPGEGVSKENILTSIATFERTIQSGWAPFDQWVEGEESAISDSAKRGLLMFAGKGACTNCHTGWNFTDHQLHDVGLLNDDIGNAAISSQNLNSIHAFKTPGLRNIAIRAPYMHNGSVPDLISVIEHYSSGGLDRPLKSPLMPDEAFTEQEKKDLISFLETLTEPNPNIEAPALPSR